MEMHMEIWMEIMINENTIQIKKIKIKTQMEMKLKLLTEINGYNKN